MRAAPSPSTRTTPPGTDAALSAGIAYLLDLQGADGSWTDVRLAVGTSDAWVTGVVGTALASAGTGRGTRATAGVDGPVGAAVGRAADWCLGALGRRDGWGFTGSVPPDADSTAWVCMLLAAAGRPVPPSALDLLDRHRVPGSGTRTYRREGAWGAPLPDVAAAALRARHAAGRLSTVDLAREWVADLAGPDEWPAYWWSSPIYPTAMVRDVWALAGRPGAAAGVPALPAPGTAFELAWSVVLALALDRPAPVAELLAAQQPDGGWPTGAFLVVPSPAGGPTVTAGDDRRLLTTASAVLALARLTPPAPLAAGRRVRVGGGGRSAAGRAADEVVRAAADAAGVEGAVGTFRELTRETFADCVPWPSAQLSALSGGVPLELSTVAGRPALRYACEVGDPLLPAGPRAASAVGALRRTAAALGMTESWGRIAAAVEVTTDPALPVGDSCRFRVWGGIDQRPGGPPRPKVYLSLLAAELGGARARLDTVLDRAGIPVPDGTAALLDRLDAAGFAHEVGFGLGPGGRIAAKAYWELDGWRPDLVRDLLLRSGLPPDLDPLRPEVPGVLRESLARRTRAGIALRLDPGDGSVRELTVAAAFPPAFVGDAEIGRRVRAWTGGDAADGVPSLFTRTVSRDDNWTTVYLRPRTGYGHRHLP